MKVQHQTMLMTALFVLVLIAVINNVKALEGLKETLLGDNGWF